jgi:hypothetical protein
MTDRSEHFIVGLTLYTLVDCHLGVRWVSPRALPSTDCPPRIRSMRTPARHGGTDMATSRHLSARPAPSGSGNGVGAALSARPVAGTSARGRQRAALHGADPSGPTASGRTKPRL